MHLWVMATIIHQTSNMRHFKWQWAVKGIAFGLLFFFLFTSATMLLWNHLATAIFGLPALSFFQTVGLMVLGRLLTGGFRPGGWRGGPGPGWRKGHYWRERWQNMTPEQREQAMQRWGKHGWGPMGNTDPGPEHPSAPAE